MYKSFFNLRANPFHVTPDPRFLSLTAHSREALSCLAYGVQKHQGFVLLTGEVGTGKTTLINVVLQWLRSQKMHVAFVFNPRLSVTEFLEFILTDFGIKCESREKGQMISALNHWLLDLHRHGETATLIVDEAQSLSPELLEEIRLLTNLETPTEKLLQIVLSGQPEFEQTVREPRFRQLRQRITLRCRTYPLTLEEVRGYISQRIKVAGGDSETIFAAEAIDAIYKMSQGVPRVINVLCEHAMINAFAIKCRPISEQIVLEAAKDLELDTTWNLTLPESAIQTMALAVNAQRAAAASSEKGENPQVVDAVSRIFEALQQLDQGAPGQDSAPGTSKEEPLEKVGTSEESPLEVIQSRQGHDGRADGTIGSNGKTDDWLKTIPHSQWNPDLQRSLFFNDDSTLIRGMEEFRRLRARLYRMREKSPLRSIAVTSALPGEGKSFVASNLAQVLAHRQERNVLLLDCDLRKGDLVTLFNARRVPGMTDYLLGQVELKEIVQRSSMDGLFFISSGSAVANPAELVSSGKFSQAIGLLGSFFEWIIIDTPPVIPVSDAVPIASACEGVVIVVRAGSTPYSLAQQVGKELRGLPVCGVILNHADTQSTKYGYFAYSQAQYAARQQIREGC